MVKVERKTRHLSPTTRFIDDAGRLTTDGFRLMKDLAEFISLIEIEDGEIKTEMLEAQIIRVSTLFADSVVITRAVANQAITEATVAVSNADVPASAAIQTLHAEPEGDRLLVRGAASMYSDNGLGFPEYGTLFLAKDGVEVASYYFWVEDVPTGYFAVEYIEDNPGEATWTLGIRSTSGPIITYGRVLQITNLKR